MEAVFSIGVGVTHTEKLLPTDGMAPGHYRIVWKLNAKNSEGTLGFTVLPPYDLQSLSALLNPVVANIGMVQKRTK